MTLACILAPVVVTIVMLSGIPNFGTLRVAMEGLFCSFDTLRDGPLSIGGSSQRDHLIINGIPDKFLTINLKKVSDTEVQDNTVIISHGKQGSQDRSNTKVGVVRVNGRRPFHNSYKLGQNAYFSVDNQRQLQFDSSVQSLTSVLEMQSRQYHIPHRTSEIWGEHRIRVWRELTAEVALYPLRYLSELGEGEPDQQIELTAGLQDCGSFLSRDGGYLRRDVYCTIVDENFKLEAPSGEDFGYVSEIAEVRSGQPVHLAVFRVDYENPTLNPDQPLSRVQELRSFTVEVTEHNVRLVFDTPGILDLPVSTITKSIDTSAVNPGSARAPYAHFALIGKSFQQFLPQGVGLLHFPFIGDALTNELYCRIELPKHGSWYQASTHADTSRFRYGEACQVGENLGVILRITKLGFPLGLLAAVWITALIHCLSGGIRPPKLQPFIFVTGAELLLAERLLIAYQASFLDWESSAALWRSLGAYIVIPYLLRTFWRDAPALNPEQGLLRGILDSGRKFKTLTAYWLPVELLLFWILATIKATRVQWCVVLAIPVAAFFIANIAANLLNKVITVSSDESKVRTLRNRLLVVGLGLFIVRIVTLLALGWKERMTLPTGVMAVSVWYTPCLLVYFALLWEYLKNARSTARCILWYYVSSLIFIMIIPLVARDVGYTLIFSLPIFILFAVPFLENPRNVRAVLGAGPFILSVIIYIILILMPNLLFKPFSGWEAATLSQAQAKKDVAEKLIANQVSANLNRLRIWDRIAPEVLRETGTTAAESLVLVMETLRAYIARGPFGEGYLRVPVARQLRDTHINDNVSAIHLIGTFGWLGGLGFLLFMAAWAIISFLPYWRESKLLERLPIQLALAFLVVWTLFIAAIYMFSGNTGFMLFTGRNIYLLAASSISDLTESCVLLMLGIWCFNPARRRP